MADYTGKKPNQILVGYTAYNCRMVINKDDPSTIKDFSFISDGKPFMFKFNHICTNKSKVVESQC